MPSLVNLARHKRRLQGHVQQGGLFVNVDLRSGQAFQSVWESVTFEKSQLAMVHFVGSKWVNCQLTDTTAYGANWNAASLHEMVFTDCDMEQASFLGASIRNVVFRNCRLAYASFAGATLHDVVFDGCNLHSCDLDYAAATGVQYSKCNLWSAKTAFGCTFWNSGIDVESCNRFAALLSRIHPDPDTKAKLRAIAGEITYKAVDRLMAEESDPEPSF